jgi:hypothetical protein
MKYSKTQNESLLSSSNSWLEQFSNLKIAFVGLDIKAYLRIKVI